MNTSNSSNNPCWPQTTAPAAWIGFDWGDAEHAFVLQDQAGHRQRDKIQHSAENLHGWLREIGPRYGGRAVVMAIEASRGAVIHALLQYPWLSIYPVNPVTGLPGPRMICPMRRCCSIWCSTMPINCARWSRKLR